VKASHSSGGPSRIPAGAPLRQADSPIGRHHTCTSSATVRLLGPWERTIIGGAPDEEGRNSVRTAYIPPKNPSLAADIWWYVTMKPTQKAMITPKNTSMPTMPAAALTGLGA